MFLSFCGKSPLNEGAAFVAQSRLIDVLGIMGGCQRMYVSAVSPVVAPQMAMVPPGRTDFIEWLQVAAPTDSITASTLRGRRATSRI